MWVARGLTTRLVCRSLCERVIGRAYELAGLKEPKTFLWFSSPMGAATAVAALQGMKGLRTNVSEDARKRTSMTVLDGVLGGLSCQMGRRFDRASTADASNIVTSHVRTRVRSLVREQVREEIIRQSSDAWGGAVRFDDMLAGDSAFDRILREVGSQAGVHEYDFYAKGILEFASGLMQRRWGWDEDYWLAYYDVFTRAAPDAFEPRALRRFESLVEVRSALNCFFPFPDMVLCCENPRVLQVDERGRLHRPDGPAVQYADGWAIWAWHGVRVPWDLIERPQDITVGEIEGEPDVEVRRIMVERMGWERYVTESGLRPIDADDWGTLYARNLPGEPEPLMIVRVLNSTPEPDGSQKYYFLRVDPRCRPLLDENQFGDPQKPTPLNAIASTFGLTGEEYRKLQVQT